MLGRVYNENIKDFLPKCCFIVASVGAEGLHRGTEQRRRGAAGDRRMSRRTGSMRTLDCRHREAAVGVETAEAEAVDSLPHHEENPGEVCSGAFIGSSDAVHKMVTLGTTVIVKNKISYTK